MHPFVLTQDIITRLQVPPLFFSLNHKFDAHVMRSSLVAKALLCRLGFSFP